MVWTSPLFSEKQTIYNNVWRLKFVAMRLSQEEDRLLLCVMLLYPLNILSIKCPCSDLPSSLIKIDHVHFHVLLLETDKQMASKT